MERKDQLITLLLNSSAREDERDDAAIGLGEFDGNDVVQVLFSVAKDVSFQSEMVKGSCGESLATIWIRCGTIDFKRLSLLRGTALHEAIGLIREWRNDWYADFIEKFPGVV